jgi:leucyl aminopeptidase
MSRRPPVLVAAHSENAASARPVRLITRGASLEGSAAAWAEANGFKGQPGRLLLCADAQGQISEALFGVGPSLDPMAIRGLADRLPGGLWRLEGVATEDAELAALAFCLGSYAFDRYTGAATEPAAQLVVPGNVDVDRVLDMARSCDLVREMVDTPAADMGPLQIETLAREISEESGATIRVITGDDLLEANYPAVHAVGRAAVTARAPRMIEMHWNAEKSDLPLLAIVGKGVVFDTGGLNLKAGAGMRFMKKDMGGAAHALGLARQVMRARLAVRLVLLVPAVENAVSGDAFRPGDVLSSRKGLTIEIGNTDAEGRLILADALARAAELEPDLTLDFATLTGAARVALGPDLPPLYTDDDALAADILAASDRVKDPVWRMPLWAPYAEALDSDIADMRNDSAVWAQAGSVTAALFLKAFAPGCGSWAHMDIFAWNPRARAGWPQGGEVQAMRACFEMLKTRYPG